MSESTTSHGQLHQVLSAAIARLASSALALCVALTSFPSAAAPAVPGEARAVIQQVRAASAGKDFVALRALMSDEFKWSHGGDGTADRAISHWKMSPRWLVQINRVTSLPCERRGPVVQCPRRAGHGFRAGFKQTADGWRMVYVITND